MSAKVWCNYCLEYHTNRTCETDSARLQLQLQNLARAEKAEAEIARLTAERDGLRVLLQDAADAIEALLPDDCDEVIITQSVLYEKGKVLERLRAALAPTEQGGKQT